MTGFTANPEKRAKMAADRLWFLGGWGESAGKSDRRKTEGPLLNQPTHSKGLVYLLWLALLPRVGEQEKRGEERRKRAKYLSVTLRNMLASCPPT